MATIIYCFVNKWRISMANAAATSDKAHAKVDGAAEKVHEAVDRAAAVAGSSEERLIELANELRDHADRLAESARSRSEAVTSAVGDYTRENPAKSIGIAFLLGAVLAFLFRK
ncbi:MAG: ElaB/YqjD/DUF883 family membrane-anchored ribosome-binding protein [Zhongshania sp.]